MPKNNNQLGFNFGSDDENIKTIEEIKKEEQEKKLAEEKALKEKKEAEEKAKQEKNLKNENLKKLRADLKKNLETAIDYVNGKYDIKKIKTDELEDDTTDSEDDDPEDGGLDE